jgi:hypothetical protein
LYSLREAIAFYVERDTDPGKWYPHDASGRLRKYDDLPAQYHHNINDSPPFGSRPGNQPAPTSSEIDDIIAFLNTYDRKLRGLGKPETFAFLGFTSFVVDLAAATSSFNGKPDATACGGSLGTSRRSYCAGCISRFQSKGNG